MINLLTRTYLSIGFLKTISLQSFPTNFLVFFFKFKSFFKLGNQRRYLRGRRRINQRRKCWTSFQTPRLQRQNICKSLLLFLFFCSSLNFCTSSLNYFCNFSKKNYFALILETKNNNDLFVENENEETLYYLPTFET